MRESGFREFYTLSEAKEFARKKEAQGFSVKITKRGDWTRHFSHVNPYVVRWVREEEDEGENNKILRKLEELRDELAMLGRDLEDLKERTGIGMNEILKTLDMLMVAVEEIEEKIERLETRFQNFLDNFPYMLPP